MYLIIFASISRQKSYICHYLPLDPYLPCREIPVNSTRKYQGWNFLPNLAPLLQIIVVICCEICGSLSLTDIGPSRILTVITKKFKQFRCSDLKHICFRFVVTISHQPVKGIETSNKYASEWVKLFVIS